MISFMKYRYLYFVLSLTVLIPGMYTLIRFGLKPAVDFTGGTLIELKMKNAVLRQSSGQELKISQEDIKKIAGEKNIEVGSIQPSGENTFILKAKTIDETKKNELLSAVKEKFGDVEETRFENVGPILGKELLQKTMVAVVLASTVILLYVAWAFKNIRFGVSAIIALIHDILVVLSIFALLGKYKGVEVDTLFVTAMLTTMSFSVHDTIIVFDRIREYQKRYGNLEFTTLIDRALTETISRSLNNSLTIIFMLLALFLLGGETTRWFILALLVGTISGAYSSPFIATPVLYIWHELRDVKH